MLSLQATGFLLAALCERLGLCLPPEARRTLLDDPPRDPESFTAAVFAAEGLEHPASHRALYREALAIAEQAFADHSRSDA